MRINTFKKSQLGTFGDLVRERAAIKLDVVKLTHGHCVTDPTHLRFNATYRTEQEATAAAFIGMARRQR